MAVEQSGTDFRTGQVLQDRHLRAGSARGGPDPREGRTVGVVRAVRKVLPEDVRAGSDQSIEHGIGVGGGTDRRDDFGVTHADVKLKVDYGSNRS